MTKERLQEIFGDRLDMSKWKPAGWIEERLVAEIKRLEAACRSHQLQRVHDKGEIEDLARACREKDRRVDAVKEKLHQAGLRIAELEAACGKGADDLEIAARQIGELEATVERQRQELEIAQQGLEAERESWRERVERLTREMADASQDGWNRMGNLAATRIGLLETDKKELLTLLGDVCTALNNVIVTNGHESPLMTKHPHPCVGLDFCVMKDAKRRCEKAEAALHEEKR